MSNKTDLQALNQSYAALIETLQGKAVGGSGGYQVAVGVVEYDGVTLSPIDAVGFKPKFVVVFLPNTNITKVEEYAADVLFLSACEGTLNGETYSFCTGLSESLRGDSLYNIESYSGSGITFYDDGSGFDVVLDGMTVPESQGDVNGFAYMYIAIG